MEFDEYALPKEATVDYVESRRIVKGRFNIFNVVAIEEEANYFIGSLIICFCSFLLGFVGFLLIHYGVLTQLGVFLLVFPLFSLAPLGVGINYLLKAKKVYNTGKKYIAIVNYDSLGFDCYLFIDGQTIKRPTISLRMPNNKYIVVIYSKKLKKFLFIKSKKDYSIYKEDPKRLQREDLANKTRACKR